MSENLKINISSDPVIRVTIRDRGEKGEKGDPGDVSQAEFDAVEGRVTDLEGQVDDHENHISSLINRVSVLEGDRLVLTNLITNGDFSDGTTGWIRYNSTFLVDNNKAIVTISASNGFIHQRPMLSTAPDQYYVMATVTAISTISQIALYNSAKGTSYVSIYDPVQNIDYKLSSLVTHIPEGSNDLAIRGYGGAGSVFEVKNAITINLTQIFGAGNEPTKEEMDKLIDILGGWFDGEITITQKQLATWLLNDIRLEVGDRYTKDETDGLLDGIDAQLADRYTKDETDGLLDGIDAQLADRYTKDETDVLLNEKATVTELEANATNIGLLNGQIRGAIAIKNFNCNIRDNFFRVVSLYQGVNAPHQGIAVLIHTPYSTDWIHQKFVVIGTGGDISKWERSFDGGTTWSSWRLSADIGLLRSGSVAASTTANQVVQGTVPFGTTYPITPHVSADVSTASPHRFKVSVLSTTTTGFTYALWSDYTGSVSVTWFAVPK